ncbi:MAG: hypothetical protein U0231_18040 [Nitrospiraceae bacterium]
MGIVAARLVDRPDKTEHRHGHQREGAREGVGADGRGVRFVPGVDGLPRAPRCLRRTPALAGLTIQVFLRIEEFRRRFDEVAIAWAGAAPCADSHVDAEVNLTDVNFGLIRELESLHRLARAIPSRRWLCGDCRRRPGGGRETPCCGFVKAGP